ncbi:MAG: hypothetical protein BWY27_00413 [Bacteroidetes bacterium ADurb.Bin234]|nr:MAG: hypothetical protein BWY27_00413 [Bacteroidetes bacterium ADurb.Bin234]
MHSLFRLNLLAPIHYAFLHSQLSEWLKLNTSVYFVFLSQPFVDSFYTEKKQSSMEASAGILLIFLDYFSIPGKYKFSFQKIK